MTRRMLSVAAIAALAAGVARATPAAPSPQTLLAEIDSGMRDAAAADDSQAARAGLLRAAAAARTLTEAHGARNAAIYRTLGSASLLAGDVPQAVLALRRAQAIDPRDPRTRDALARARAQVGLAISPSLPSRVERLALAWRGVVPRSVLWWAATGAFTLAWVLLATRWLRGTRRPPLRVASGAMLASGALLAPLAAEWLVLARGQDAVVLTPTAGLRGPGTGVFEPAFEGPIPAGTEARIVEDRDGWARLRLIDGRECWLPRSAVEAVDPL